ncbi:MAG: undecaprenyldiphospho-muramoylpentapeptide beta-N-acetylglucosaminyltransferase [Alphaproteobacteria bacterium]|nr:undecaprenyldiphospho-muramoylpentapeptide beta-N-acetylglucosaminyltransferase [Alphaproteobacteria bacterium]
MSKTYLYTVVLAAGGTGGHVFPAEALAQELERRNIHPVLITDARASQFSGVYDKVEHHIIRAGRVSGGVFRRVLGGVDIVIGMLQARRLIKKMKPKVVIGFGGYPSFPTMFAAESVGVPTIIHEQNAVLGRANRVLAHKMDRIATSFAETFGLRADDKHKVVLTGNPVRAAIRALKDVPYPELVQDGAMRILVMGGSLGATVFSRVVPQALELLPEALRARLRIDQQCRPEDLKATRKLFEKIGVAADLSKFFNDVPARLASAHLVITRSGASTVAELMTAGRPAILVPIPNAMDNHQAINANAAEESGCGWVMPQDAFTPQALSARIEAFLSLPSSLNQAAEKARAAVPDNAAAKLADLVEQLAQGKHAVQTEEKIAKEQAA